MRVKTQILAQWKCRDNEPRFGALVELRENGRLYERVDGSTIWSDFYFARFDERRETDFDRMKEKATEFLTWWLNEPRNRNRRLTVNLVFRRKEPEKVEKETTLAQHKARILATVGDVF